MSDFQLDGADIQGVPPTEFSYTLPRPFGPDRGQASLTIWARPAIGTNTAYKAAIERIQSGAKLADMVNQKNHRKSEDDEKFIAQNDAAVKKVMSDTFEALYDHCIVKWETTIQKDKKNLEANKENFMGLVHFAHPDVAEMIDQIRRDLGNHSKFAGEAADELLEEEAKN